jgi:hypothetical protein
MITKPTKAERITGWIIAAPAAGLLLFSVAGKFLQPAGMEEKIEKISLKMS